jgi:multicomponent Na+:H+ antiporter subunit F
MIDTAAHIALGLLAIATLITLWRLRGGGVCDRVVALDLMTTIAVCAMPALAVLYDVAWFLDVALVLSLVAFVATLAFARTVEEKS